MLSVEEIKKACEFADGFGYDDMGLNTNQYCFGWGLLKELNGHSISGYQKWIDIYYPLFLQRVIEGINRDDRFVIEQRKRDYVAGANGSFNYQSNLSDYDSIDQAKEQAIKYILGEMK